MKQFLRLSLVLGMLLALMLGGTAQAQEQEDGDGEFVFGMILVGPTNDRGWSQSHTEGGRYVEENMDGARMLVFESLNPTDTPEVTLQDVVANMVEEGAQLIFTTSDAFEEDTNVVAEEYPEVVFINVTGSNVLEGAPENVGNVMVLMEIPRLMAGCAAGLMTDTGQIGYLGALINPETRRLAVTSYLAARYCYENYRNLDPADLSYTVTWIGFWFNIPGVTLDPTEVVNNFYDNGADVVLSGIDTTEAIVVAGQRRADGEDVYAMPYGNANGCAEAPEACLGVAFYNWGPAYLDIAQEVRAGEWEQAWELLPPDYEDLNNPDTSPLGYVNGEGLSEDAAEQLDAFYEEIVAYQTDPDNEDTLFLWEGPLSYQDGSELAEPGEKVDIIDIWYTPQLLEGMIGASE